MTTTVAGNAKYCIISTPSYSFVNESLIFLPTNRTPAWITVHQILERLTEDIRFSLTGGGAGSDDLANMLAMAPGSRKVAQAAVLLGIFLRFFDNLSSLISETQQQKRFLLTHGASLMRMLQPKTFSNPWSNDCVIFGYEIFRLITVLNYCCRSKFYWTLTLLLKSANPH